jgi:putative multiple sugar transport system substrate-binding protein
MKRISLLAIACLFFAMSFCSCRDAGRVVGVSLPNPWNRWDRDGASLKAALEAKGVKVDLRYADDVVANQIEAIGDMVKEGCKVLVVGPVDGSALGAALEGAKARGAEVLSYDRLIMGTPDVDYYATFDNFQVGVMQGRFIVGRLGLDKGNGPFYVELFAGSPSDSNAAVFFKGAMSVLGPCVDSGALKVRSGQKDFASVATPGWEQARAQSRMADILAKHYSDGARLAAVLCPNDELARPVAAALADSDYGTAAKPFPVLTGQDCIAKNVKAMIAGRQAMSVFKDTRALAAQAAAMVEAMLAGKRVAVNEGAASENGAKAVPTSLCEPVSVDAGNYKSVLVDSGYYAARDLE